PPEWQGQVRVHFELVEPLSLDTAVALNGSTLQLAPAEIRTIDLPSVPAEFILPDGFEPVIEVVAKTASGPVAVRRGTVTMQRAGS
ncbi:MAG: hypothetical protein JSW51_05425, partial [Gemmatimonadota bacterium]